MNGARVAETGDIPGIVGLQLACFPPPFLAELLWLPEHIEAHMSAFSAGQFVWVEDGLVVGSASSLIVSEDAWCQHLSWEETTGGFFFSGHDPSGTTLYGADISVHPEFRGQGIGRALYQARFELVLRLGLVRYGTACRVPDYSEKAEGQTVEEFVRDVERGAKTDRTLTPLLRFGLCLVGVAHGHMEDEESGNAAAVLEWTP